MSWVRKKDPREPELSMGSRYLSSFPFDIFFSDDELTSANWLLILVMFALNFYGWYLLWEERGAKHRLSNLSADSADNSASPSSSPQQHVNIIGAKWPLKQFRVNVPPVGIQPGSGSPPPFSPPSSPSGSPPSTPRGRAN
jgi:hypothetical protein